MTALIAVDALMWLGSYCGAGLYGLDMDAA